MTTELAILWTALACNTLAGLVAIGATVLDRRWDRLVLALLVAGLALHGVSIGLRWERLGHGPFITMFEALSSNIWSLLLIFTIAYWRVPAVRPGAVVVMPILFVMMGWLLASNPDQGHLPPTYQTAWLYVHTVFGKVFLGTVLVGVGLAGMILMRHFGVGSAWLSRLPESSRLENLAFRFMIVGFLFESLMLVAGAVWARDAWGRFWAWDPLETWAFITWLCLAAYIHARVTLKLSPHARALAIMGVFVLAFLTFFGVPFVTTAPHQGAV